jgi:hypothetical protein
MWTRRFSGKIPGVLFLIFTTAFGSQTLLPDTALAQAHRVFAFNDLGMHCYDPDYSVLSILPLFNTVHAQVIRQGRQPTIMNGSTVRLVYNAQADATGSINTTSARKTNFWRWGTEWFTGTLPVNVGITGTKMPGPRNRARPFRPFDPAKNWFVLEGVPITILDDARLINPFSLFAISAIDRATDQLLYSLPTVVPASNEVNCGVCHKTGGVAANPSVDPTIVWSTVPNLEKQSRLNILLLHNKRNATELVPPVRCSSCHYDPAVDLTDAGPQNTLPFFSHAMHGFHARKIPQDPRSLATCANCHPASPVGSTACLRGAMGVAGIVCISCHGNMFNIGNEARQPWVDEPKCQSCHTGDAVDNLGAIRFTKAYTGKPRNPVFRVAVNQRFAENPNTLFRNSLGHNGVACESCHGSPHAEWPSREANDNAAAVQLQGYRGPIRDCKVCHGTALPPTTEGPHGLHNVNDRAWFSDGEHASFFENDQAGCMACHGNTLTGTVLSVTPVPRRFVTEEGTFSVARGTPIRCNLCHDSPL